MTSGVESLPPYHVARLHASPAQWARAPRYSTLTGAWDALDTGLVVRDSRDDLVAFHESVTPFL